MRTILHRVQVVLARCTPVQVLKPVIVTHIITMKGTKSSRSRADERFEYKVVDVNPLLAQGHLHVPVILKLLQ